MAPCIREHTRPRYRLNKGEELRNKSLEYLMMRIQHGRYLLTGSLAKAANLRSLLKLDHEPHLQPAVAERVCNMQLRHCNALIDCIVSSKHRRSGR
jgi:hypothetical protein